MTNQRLSEKDDKKMDYPLTCMFAAVSEDVSEVRDYSMKGFVDFYLKVNKKEN